MKEFPIRDEHDDTLNDGDPRTGYELDECGDEYKFDPAIENTAKVVNAVSVIDEHPNLAVACLKDWWKSKTIWTDIATIAVAVYEMLARYNHWGPIPAEVFVILGALGIYGRKNTTAVLK